MSAFSDILDAEFFTRNPERSFYARPSIAGEKQDWGPFSHVAWPWMIVSLDRQSMVLRSYPAKSETAPVNDDGYLRRVITAARQEAADNDAPLVVPIEASLNALVATNRLLDRADRASLHAIGGEAELFVVDASGVTERTLIDWDDSVGMFIAPSPPIAANLNRHERRAAEKQARHTA